MKDQQAVVNKLLLIEELKYNQLKMKKIKMMDSV